MPGERKSARRDAIGRAAVALALGALAILTGLAVLIGAPLASGADETTPRGPSGLPLPRFVSLKSDRVNVRQGPTRDHAVAWIFTRQGLPVEILAEFDNWRRVRDSEGDEGWVFHSLLSGRRTALVAPWAKDSLVDLHRRADRKSPVVARLEPEVLVDVGACDGAWCRVKVKGGPNGFVPQESLWGVYQDEHLD